MKTKAKMTMREPSSSQLRFEVNARHPCLGALKLRHDRGSKVLLGVARSKWRDYRRDNENENIEKRQ